ncbi:peptidyl-arginine deiminase [Seonamhaeicola aphaedonensis]|uniref:Peptidyl-arginine deiminase n=1 Tax=Seonamhaeicola aphaedonensis TaxID=1461338 RepID=A0A3D9HJ44_9FLAO|nr:peptidyl-arginine deiminase [Seonamhaeicola aphaedonensis]
MKRKIIVLICLVLAISFAWHFIALDQDYQASTDFDETESHLLVWSPVYINTYRNFIKNLAEDDHVILFVPNTIEHLSVFNDLKLFGVNIDNIQLQTVSNTDIWIRDYGPSFLLNENGKLKTLSFNYYNLKRHSFPY